jgi:hypothetical protein
MKRTKLRLNRETIRQLAEHDLRRAAAGARNDSLDEASCNPCGDWPTSPYRGCTL